MRRILVAIFVAFAAAIAVAPASGQVFVSSVLSSAHPQSSPTAVPSGTQNCIVAAPGVWVGTIQLQGAASPSGPWTTIGSQLQFPGTLPVPLGTAAPAYISLGSDLANGAANATLSCIPAGGGGGSVSAVTGSLHALSSGGTAPNITTDGTNANTGSTLVARDGSGNFSASNITLSGHLSTAAVFNVMSPTYGAKCDGTTDDSAAIIAAANAANAVAGALTFPSGKTCYYNSATAITLSGASVQGEGSILLGGAATTDAFVITSGENTYNLPNVKSFANGAAIRVKNAGVMTVNVNSLIGNHNAIVLDCEGTNGPQVLDNTFNVTFIAGSYDGIVLYGSQFVSGSPNQGGDIEGNIFNVNFLDNNTHAAIAYLAAGGATSYYATFNTFNATALDNSTGGANPNYGVFIAPGLTLLNGYDVVNATGYFFGPTGFTSISGNVPPNFSLNTVQNLTRANPSTGHQEFQEPITVAGALVPPVYRLDGTAAPYKAHIVQDQVLASSTSTVITFAGLAAFNSAATYTCNVLDVTSSTIITSNNAAVSGTSFQFGSTSGHYYNITCIGV